MQTCLHPAAMETAQTCAVFRLPANKILALTATNPNPHPITLSLQRGGKPKQGWRTGTWTRLTRRSPHLARRRDTRVAGQGGAGEPVTWTRQTLRSPPPGPPWRYHCVPVCKQLGDHTRPAKVLSGSPNPTACMHTAKQGYGPQPGPTSAGDSHSLARRAGLSAFRIYPQCHQAHACALPEKSPPRMALANTSP